ncbi:MAG: DNA repair protein RecO [Oscillospiraceae bacterium]|nr:DNA repair protein RecO [Oscillospiraceae bacterium]
MQQERIVTAGLVLRDTVTKESDKILTVLTADLGRISVIAKGARSRKSKVTAACQLLCYSDMTLSPKGEWYYLAEANTIQLFDGLRRDIVKLALGAYFAELTEAVCTPVPEPELLRLLLNALYALSALDKPAALVKPAFTWRLMELGGFAPLIDGCAVCGREPPERPVLDVVHGLVHCAACKTDGFSLPLTDSALRALRHILYGDSKKLYAFSLDDAGLRLLDQAAEAFSAAQLERSFRTLDYYKGIASYE